MLSIFFPWSPRPLTCPGTDDLVMLARHFSCVRGFQFLFPIPLPLIFFSSRPCLLFSW